MCSGWFDRTETLLKAEERAKRPYKNKHKTSDHPLVRLRQSGNLLHVGHNQLRTSGNKLEQDPPSPVMADW